MSISLYTKSGKKAYRAKFKHQHRQYTQAGFPTKEAAKDWIASEKRRLKREAANPPAPTPRVLMFSKASTKYLEDCEARMQIGTVNEKLRHYKIFVQWLGGDIAMQAITPSIAQDFAADYLQSVHEDNLMAEEKNPDFTPVDPNKNTNRVLRNLKALWNWYNKRQHLGPNPFDSVEPYPEDTEPQYVPPTEDVAKVLAKAHQWQRDFLEVMTRTGARPGEVRKLEWDDINFSRGTITFWTRKRRGGAKEPRTINMTSHLSKVLKRRFEDRVSETFVFTNPITGKLLGRQDRPYKYMMERLCAEADVTPFTFYGFRRFVATRLRDSGKASNYDIQHILGHKRSATTDIYLRTLAPDVKVAISTMDDIQPEEDETTPLECAKVSKFSHH